MSRNLEILHSFASDFTNVLGVPCKLVGESNKYAIGRSIGNHGAVEAITQHYDPATLQKVCVDYLNALNMPKLNLETRSNVGIGFWKLPRYVGPVPIGANCWIRVKDTGEESQVYISFDPGFDPDGECETDCFGIKDENIYFFAVGGEAELKSIMDQPSEFEILNYDLVYEEIEKPEDLTHAVELTDHREVSGQLYVDVIPKEGKIDDFLAATFEVNHLPGTKTETPCLHVHFDESNLAASFFKKGDSYIIRPETDVTITPIVLDDGSNGYLLS